MTYSAVYPIEVARPSAGLNLMRGWFYFGTMFAAASVILGTLPGFAVLCLTNARFRPWRSLPVVLLGALIGFTVTVLPLWNWPGASTATTLVDVATFAGPTLGGVIASLTIRRRMTGSSASYW